jgi:transcriptional regulator with XRE-family HTH domain
MWRGVLREIATACPLVAESCRALLQLDPLRAESDQAIERHAAQIRRVLSDPALARRMYRERDREAFGNRVASLRKALGWSLRRLARESADTAKQIRFGVRAPDRFQLMDYEAGRSNAHPTTKQVLASALGVPVDDLEAAPCAPLKMPAHLPVAVNSPLPCAPSYKTGIFIVRDETDFVAPPSRLST